MIRGPVLPQVREHLWSLVSTRLDRIESGLRLVLEGLDCSDGQLGLVEGLARDAMGGPVLVLLATEGDALLPARVLAAGNFLERVGDALVRAVPEAGFCPGVSGRVLVVGTEAARAALEQAACLPVAALQVCALEPFRVAGSERFAVRWMPMGGAHVRAGGEPAGMGAPTHAFVTPAETAELWLRLSSICQRIAPGVQFHGDRFSRVITCNGALLGEVRTTDGGLVGSAATGAVRDLRDLRDVCWFGDQLLRVWSRHAGLDLDGPAASGKGMSSGDSVSSVAGKPADARATAPRHAANGRDLPPAGESLRSSLEASRLSSEEYSALGAPPSSGGPGSEGVVVEDRQQTPLAKRAAPQVGRAD